MGRAKPLKDREFNLGGAYSFGAKIGIIGPAYPVIISREKIGGDAKEHLSVRSLRVVQACEVARQRVF